MTDEEMTEEYVRNNWDKNVTELKNDTTYQYVKGSPNFYDTAQKQAFLAGLKAGKNINVATKWHKVADGDLPKDENDVLVYSGEDWRM